MGFEAEVDMLSPLGAAAESFAGPGAVAIYEVPAAAGIPDVVAVTFDSDVLRSRDATGFLTNPALLGAFLTLSDWLGTDTALTSERVAASIGVTSRYAGSRVLPLLAERGLASTPAYGQWMAIRPYVSVARRLVTIEAKLRDWKRGLGQAARHAAGADEAWLAIDEAHVRAAAASAHWFHGTGVGLASVSESRVPKVHVAPGSPQILRMRRELLAERAAELYSAGSASGPIGKVFGRELTPTKGFDPRRQGAAAN